MLCSGPNAYMLFIEPARKTGNAEHGMLVDVQCKVVTGRVQYCRRSDLPACVLRVLS